MLAGKDLVFFHWKLSWYKLETWSLLDFDFCCPSMGSLHEGLENHTENKRNLKLEKKREQLTPAIAPSSRFSSMESIAAAAAHQV
uniref:Uncharacterized protein n=1 Tax=Salix viminalis TaxID=40686 RepID=A0A6N2L882_SALVM